MTEQQTEVLKQLDLVLGRAVGCGLLDLLGPHVKHCDPSYSTVLEFCDGVASLVKASSNG